MYDDGFDKFGERRPPDVHFEPQKLSQIKIIQDIGRRRRWSRDEKAQITSESFMPGNSISDVARRHGMSLGLLHHWRRAARNSAADVRQSFVPVLQAAPSAISPVIGRTDAGVIEIDFCGANIKLRGSVCGSTLTAILSAVRNA